MYKNEDLYATLDKYESVVDQSYIAAAVKSKKQEDVKLLVCFGGKVNMPESERFFNRTPLFFAIFNNDIPMIRLLLQFGAKTNVTDYIEGIEGKTPLEYAMTRTKNIETVKVLVEEGNANIQCVLTQSVLDNTPKEITDYVLHAAHQQQQQQDRKVVSAKPLPLNSLNNSAHDMQ